MCKKLCNKCYSRVKRGGTPELSKKQQMALRICDIVGCGKPHVAKGLCANHRMAARRANNPAMKATAIEYTRQWKLRNPEKHAAQQARQHEKHKDAHNAYRAKWKKDNRVTYNAYLASRKVRVRQVTPKWADLAAIRLFYFNCPKGYHVDHIVPINGNNVTGLHTIENLQYLLALVNLKKSNKFVA